MGRKVASRGMANRRMIQKMRTQSALRFKHITAEFSADEKAALYHDTAARVYRTEKTVGADV